MSKHRNVDQNQIWEILNKIFKIKKRKGKNNNLYKMDKNIFKNYKFLTINSNLLTKI